jgi:predicted ABC-type ATPase
LAKQRVATRVLEGGHDIEVEVIERRFMRGIKNLFEIYLPLVNNTFIFDNSEGSAILIAEKQFKTEMHVVD